MENKKRNKKRKEEQNKKEPMNNTFDELTKGLARSVTRRQALLRFGVGIAGIALAIFGVPSRAQGQSSAYKQCVERCLQGCFLGLKRCHNVCNHACHGL